VRDREISQVALVAQKKRVVLAESGREDEREKRRRKRPKPRQ
jgi:hypothetical protein